MAELKIKLTTPERQVLSIEGDSISLPTSLGEITILSGHEQMVALIAPGMATVRRGSEEEYLAISGGFVQVGMDGEVSILADTAERAEELDIKAVEEARERARELLSEERRKDDVSAAAAVAALERELSRLRVAEKYRTKRSFGRQPHIEQ